MPRATFSNIISSFQRYFGSQGAEKAFPAGDLENADRKIQKSVNQTKQISILYKQSVDVYGKFPN
jgi:hypothetical protein